jgi:DNA-binding transcriptional ArsR family regulator
MDPETLAACKTLMNRDRLRIVGALAARDATTDELAEALNVPRRTVARHLERLRTVALVRPDPVIRDGETVYILALARLAVIAADLARFEAAQQPSISELPGAEAAAPEGGWSRDDQKVLHTFVQDGRLTDIPAQLSKRMVILRFLAATAFTPGEDYPEKDVNMRLALRHPDVASLRRYLVDEGFMERAAGVYSLREPGDRHSQSRARDPED